MSDRDIIVIDEHGKVLRNKEGQRVMLNGTPIIKDDKFEEAQRYGRQPVNPALFTHHKEKKDD